MCGLLFHRISSGRARRDKLGEDLAAQVARLLDPAVKLAVGECSGSAFAELRIAFRHQDTAPPQPPGIARAFTNDAAAFQDERAEAHFRQHQCGEQATGAGADHHRPRRKPRRGTRHRSPGNVRNWTDLGSSEAVCPPARSRRSNRPDWILFLLPRVVTAPRHRPRERRVLVEPKAGADRGGKRLVGMIERQTEFRKTRHQPFGVMTKTLLGSS